MKFSILDSSIFLIVRQLKKHMVTMLPTSSVPLCYTVDNIPAAPF